MLAGLASLLAGEEERFCQESENRIIFRSDWDAFALPAYFCKESNQASSSTVPDSSRQESVKTVSESKLGIDFTRACQHDFTIKLKSAAQDCSKVTVRQLPDEDEQLGAVVWDCGLVLCRILDRITAQLGPDWLHKTLVVELGSGTGVVGLCAAQLGAKRLVLSDRAEMLELLTSNCNGTLAPNSLAQTSAFSCQVSQASDPKIHGGKLSLALVLHASTVGIEHTLTVQAAKNLRHCLLAQKKTREAQELERNLEQTLVKLRKRLELKRTTKQAASKDAKAADATRESSEEDAYQSMRRTIAQARSNDESNAQKLPFERSIFTPVEFAGSFGLSKTPPSKRTIYPRWNEFRAETTLDVDGASDVVATLPVPSGKEGTVVFRGNQFTDVGSFSVHYLLHGSFFSIGSSAAFDICHVHISLVLLNKDIRSGDAIHIQYSSSLKQGQLQCDWIGLFREDDEYEEEDDIYSEYPRGSPDTCILRFRSMGIERHVRMCIITNPGDLKQDRLALREALNERLEDFRRRYRVQITLVDLADHIIADDMCADKLDDLSRGMSGVEALFHEIEACRPFNFLLVADRFGWLLRDGVPARLERMMPWLQSEATKQRSILDVAAEFAVETPLAQGEDSDVEAVLFWKCTRADPLDAALGNTMENSNPERLEADADENFDGLLRLEERMWRECGLEALSYESIEELASNTADQVLDELEAVFPEEAVPSARRVVMCSMESVANLYRRRVGELSPGFQQIMTSLEAFALFLPRNLPYSLHDLTELQVKMVRKTVRTLGADAEATLRERLGDSLFLPEINPTWSRVDSCAPDVWDRGTPLALVASPLAGKSTLVSLLMENLHASMLPWGDLTPTATELTTRQFFVHKGTRHILIGLFLGSSSKFRTGASIASYVVQEALEALGETTVLGSMGLGSPSQAQHQQQSAGHRGVDFDVLIPVLQRHKARLILVLDDVDEVGVNWLPRTLDPFLFRVIMTMKPNSAAYQSAKQRLFNFAYLAQAFPSDLLDKLEKGAGNVPAATLRSVTGKLTSRQTCAGLDAITDMNAVTTKLVKKCMAELGSHQGKAAELLQLCKSDPTWWCHIFERVNPASFKRQLICDDATIGRFNLVLFAWEANILNESGHLSAIKALSTRDLVHDILGRLVKQRPTAGLMLQVLVRPANKAVAERELMSIIESHRHWNAVHYSVARRFFIETIAEPVAGKLVLRNQWLRETIEEFLHTTSVPKLTHHQQSTLHIKSGSPQSTMGGRQRRLSHFMSAASPSSP
ncbi:Protein-lysine methyltransferase METTL21D [Hondaea fermentalgiana]|uniref:Protein-lysine methyltransferase METTL21D n=1 Tax=Hondaea fermentalgiana TaxID=2315210 RepID=A0A2R5FZY8_9STRA|nr:Protein-lysine methyltransferase METTL21D [Hondaea fermentalgiana]|eukprot:GBG24336.1 Protein-lysine methyltransferase METTL21D [Hondaea fermentalgiana]